VVDSEYTYDKFFFVIDDKAVWIENTIAPVISSFPLSIGHHRLKWIYSKDSSLDVGSDSTTIWYIQITGLFDHSDYCNLCKPGTTSTIGSSDCTECLLNQYNSLSGSSTCYDCPANQYSFPGDTNCTDKLECTSDDWQEFYTECSAFNRTKYYRWIQPQICLNTTLQLPDQEPNHPCEDCNPGQYRDDDACHFCPAGEYTTESGTQSTCEQCPIGHYTPKQLNLNTWNDWPNNSVTTCTGECGATAWRLRSTHIDSGTNHGAPVSSSFTIPVIIETWPHGTVQYNFTLACPSSSWCYLKFLMELHYFNRIGVILIFLLAFSLVDLIL